MKKSAMLALRSCLIALVLLTQSCQRNSFVEEQKKLKDLRELILSCDIPQLESVKPLSVDQIDSIIGPDENGIKRPCYYESWSEVTEFDEMISLNPNNNAIWPGAAIQGKSLQNGSLNLISLARSGGRITVTGLNFNDNKPNYVDVNNTSESEVKESVKNLISRPSPVTDASFSYSNSQIFSVENALTSMGLSAKWSWGAFSSQLSTTNFSSKSVFVVKLTQKYYSVSFSDPKSPESIFAPNVSLNDAKLYMNKGNPPAVITNVNYGRILFLIIETSEDAESFKAALNGSFSGWLADGSTNFTSEQSKKIQNSDIKIFAIGGNSKSIAEVITAGEGKSKLDKVKAYIEEGASFSSNSTGVPIGYKAIYLSNNQIAAINSASKFKKVRCDFAPYRKPLKVTVNKFITRDVTDDDEDMEFSYRIQFLGENDQVLDELSNHKPVTYVEELAKTGNREKEGVNTFFINESKTVNQPIFRVRCIIWAKSHDGDCDKPWGEAGKSVSRDISMPDFNNIQLFSAWNSLDLYIKIE